MREKDLENKLVKAVWDSGGLALKFISPNLNGVSDRLYRWFCACIRLGLERTEFLM